MGFPIRTSPGQSLLPAHRGLSQVATSFIGPTAKASETTGEPIAGTNLRFHGRIAGKRYDQRLQTDSDGIAAIEWPRGAKVNNLWMDCTCDYSNDYIFDVHGVHASAGVYCAGNEWRKIMAEKANGGIIRLRGCSHSLIDGVQCWDTFLNGDIQKPLISLEAGAGGLNTRLTEIHRAFRDNSPRGALAPDIFLDGADMTTLINCGGPADYAIVETANATQTQYLNCMGLV